MSAKVLVKEVTGGITVVTIVTPPNVEELNHQWANCYGLSPSWEDESAHPLLDALRPITMSEVGAVVIDLTGTFRSSSALFAVVNDTWLALSAQGRGMALATHDLTFDLLCSGLQAKCPVAGSVADAIPLALSISAVQPLDKQTALSLDAIEERLRSLIRARIGLLYGDQEPPYPPVARLFKVGVASGSSAFPYGGWAWSITGEGTTIQLEYNDHARVADGWGCRYTISSGETLLVGQSNCAWP